MYEPRVFSEYGVDRGGENRDTGETRNGIGNGRESQNKLSVREEFRGTNSQPRDSLFFILGREREFLGCQSILFIDTLVRLELKHP